MPKTIDLCNLTKRTSRINDTFGVVPTLSEHFTYFHQQATKLAIVRPYPIDMPDRLSRGYLLALTRR